LDQNSTQTGFPFLSLVAAARFLLESRGARRRLDLARELLVKEDEIAENKNIRIARIL